jgi:monoamine oxidase
VIVTVPLGVLQQAPGRAGTIQFEPEPKTIMNAAAKLDFGQVYRVTFRFVTRFWEDDKKLAEASFLLSHEKLFPVWWTSYPVLTPLLTGWSAGPAGEVLQGAKRSEVVAAALGSLSRMLNRDIPSPAGVYFHDWFSDPFFRGAYSYVPVKAGQARKALATPVEKTLFFAGEAADTGGHGGTVHGAIASGRRAARLLLAASGRRRKPR